MDRMMKNGPHKRANMTDDIEMRRKRENSGIDAQSSDHHTIEEIIESIPIGIIIQDAEGRDVMANGYAEKILGIGRREITRRRYDSKEWDPRGRDGLLKKREDMVAEKVRRTGKPVFGEEVRIPRPDGSRAILIINAAPMIDTSGSYGGLVYAFEDITQRIRVEEELEVHEERLRELVEARTAELEEANRMLRLEIEERKLKERELQIMTEQLRTLSQRMETAREEEKADFAARIHNTFEQSLAVLKMQVKDFERSLSSDEKKSGGLETIYKTLNVFLDEIQGVSEELRPRILNDAGLVAAMEWKIEDVRKRMDIDISFQSDVGGLIIAEVLGTFIYRVFQEALENALLHSEATCIRTDLSIVGETLTLSVIDDGRGISHEELANPKSLGLLWMKERAKHLGGIIDIIGHPEKGTEVALRIPVASV
jgi:PAS domain S-box-containing protein